jgi:hypothetical protein
MTNSEFEIAVDVAAMIYKKCLTPVAVLRYWDTHIHEFNQGALKFPPLPFLKNASIIDQVAVARIDDRGRPVAPPSAPKAHGFSDLTELDRRLRPALRGAGFKVDQFKDDILLVVQKTAGPTKRGIDCGLPLEVEKMTNWVAENVVELDDNGDAVFNFGEVDDED